MRNHQKMTYRPSLKVARKLSAGVNQPKRGPSLHLRVRNQVTVLLLGTRRKKVLTHPALILSLRETKGAVGGRGR